MEFWDNRGKFSFSGGTQDRLSKSGTVRGVSGWLAPLLYSHKRGGGSMEPPLDPPLRKPDSRTDEPESCYSLSVIMLRFRELGNRSPSANCLLSCRIRNTMAGLSPVTFTIRLTELMVMSPVIDISSK